MVRSKDHRIAALKFTLNHCSVQGLCWYNLYQYLSDSCLIVSWVTRTEYTLVERESCLHESLTVPFHMASLNVCFVVCAHNLEVKKCGEVLNGWRCDYGHRRRCSNRNSLLKPGEGILSPVFQPTLISVCSFSIWKLRMRPSNLKMCFVVTSGMVLGCSVAVVGTIESIKELLKTYQPHTWKCCSVSWVCKALWGPWCCNGGEASSRCWCKV